MRPGDGPVEAPAPLLDQLVANLGRPAGADPCPALEPGGGTDARHVAAVPAPTALCSRPPVGKGQVSNGDLPNLCRD